MDGLKKSDDKVCRVCGDKALGYNFSVITCESCKAFFRRNAVKNKYHKCPFQNECKIDVVTRRFCQKCRLDKCLSVGMKKEWIMSDEEKQLKNAKINENKVKKKLEGGWNVPDHVIAYPMSSPISESSNSSSPYNGVQFMQYTTAKPQARVNAMPQQQTAATSVESPPSKMLRTIDNGASNLASLIADEGGFTNAANWQNANHALPSVSSIMNKNSENQCAETSTENFASKSLVEMLSPNDNENARSEENQPNCEVQNGTGSGKSWLKGTVNDVLDIAILAEYSELAANSGLKSYGSTMLTTLEVQKINELLTASAVLKLQSKDDKSVFEKGPNACLIDVINMTDNAIRKLIKMSKRLTAFKNLCQEDQIALLKGSCTELMILRSVISYDSEKECWQVPEITYIKMDVLKEAKGNIYEEHKRFVQSFDSIWRNDETLMLILSAIVLFTPTRPNIAHSKVIEKEQYSYYFLLQRYLESKNAYCNAKDQFFKLIQMVKDLQKLNENHVRVFLDVNPKDVEPLLIEIFDLCS